jgi:hypothetical protein
VILSTLSTGDGAVPVTVSVTGQVWARGRGRQGGRVGLILDASPTPLPL